ncbi:DUF1090 family protein [Burkholderia sp. PU8-34]
MLFKWLPSRRSAPCRRIGITDREYNRRTHAQIINETPAKLLMKKILIAATIPFVLLTSSHAIAGKRNCAARIAAIQAQIDNAKRYGNTHKAIGKQAALAHVEANCSGTGQYASTERKLRDKQRSVRSAQDDVRQAEERLREAQASGDAKEIAKAQRKLAKKQNELRDKTSDLREVEADLGTLKR